MLVAAIPRTVQLSAYLQDSRVEREPASVTLEADKVGDRLEGPRLEIEDPLYRRARPNAEGNYLEQPATPQFDQVTSFATAQETLDLAERLADQSIEWAFSDRQLGVRPHQGNGMNAYYVRQDESIQFYSFDSRPLDKTVQVSQCADVVAHETGHALLDGLKPEFLYDWGGHSRAFHESFGDCMAILVAASRPALVERALSETGGDLLRDNPINRVAEEFGLAWRKAWNPSDERLFLRNANNNFLYVPMEELPENGSPDELTRQDHSYGQIFTGAFYRCLVAMAGPGGQNLSGAAAELGRLLLHAVAMQSPSSTTLPEVARCMLTADRQLYGGAHEDTLSRVFTERQLLSAEEVQAWRRQYDELPRLQKTSDPVRFLRRHQQALGVDASAYQLYRTVRDRQGRERWEFLSRQRVQAEGLAGEVKGGLTLTFGPDGKLSWLSRQDITRERIAEACLTLSKLGPEDISLGPAGGHLYPAELGPDGLVRRSAWLRD